MEKHVILLQQKLEDHIDEYHRTREEEKTRWDNLIKVQEENTRSLSELARANKELTESTRDIITAWNAANGTIKTLSTLSKFFKWLSGFAVVGITADWLAGKFLG